MEAMRGSGSECTLKIAGAGEAAPIWAGHVNACAVCLTHHLQVDLDGGVGCNINGLLFGEASIPGNPFSE